MRTRFSNEHRRCGRAPAVQAVAEVGLPQLVAGQVEGVGSRLAEEAVNRLAVAGRRAGRVAVVVANPFLLGQLGLDVVLPEQLAVGAIQADEVPLEAGSCRPTRRERYSRCSRSDRSCRRREWGSTCPAREAQSSRRCFRWPTRSSAAISRPRFPARPARGTASRTPLRQAILSPARASQKVQLASCDILNCRGSERENGLRAIEL